jgi:hypothetical protein
MRMDAQRFDWILDGLDEGRLTEWEIGFIEQCKERMETKGDLTPGQEDKLEEIFREKTR